MAEADPPDVQRAAGKMNFNLKERASAIFLNNFLVDTLDERAEVRHSNQKNLPTVTRNRKLRVDRIFKATF